MPSTRFEIATLFVGLALVAAVVAVGARNWHRNHETRTATATETTAAATDRQRRIASSTARAAARAPAKPAAKLATLVLSASRGTCWVSARVGSPDGPTLYEGSLAEGQQVRFAKTRLWLRLGAAGNLQATLNGRTLTSFPQGTIDIVVTARGIAPATAA